MVEITDWDEMRKAWEQVKPSGYAWFRTNTRDGFMIQMTVVGIGQVIDYSRAVGAYMNVGDLVQVTSTGIEIRSHMTAQPKHTFSTRVVMLVSPFDKPVAGMSFAKYFEEE